MAARAPRPVRTPAWFELAAPLLEEDEAELLVLVLVLELVLELELEDDVVIGVLELLGVLTVPLTRTVSMILGTTLPSGSYTV